MRVGASKVKVTPDSSVFLSGFPRGRRSTGVHDDIWVRCLSIRDDENLLSIVTADVWGVLREDVDEIASELKLDSTRHLLLCSTHVHSAPDMLGFFGPSSRTSGTDENYVKEFRSAVVQCVNDSRLSMRDTSVKVANGKNGIRIESARTPGLVDAACLNIYLVEKNGRGVHTIVNSTCPPVLSDEENTKVSSDWLNSFYSRTDERMGGVSLFLQGSPGGILPPIIPNRTFEGADKVGRAMSEQAVNSYAKAMEIQVDHVDVTERTLEVPVENRLMMALSALGTFRGRVHNKRRTTVSTVRIGPLTIATFPGSTFPQVAFEAKEMMRTPYKAVASFANDCIGFIIPSSEFDPAKYEERISLGRDVAAVLVSGLAQPLEIP